MERRWKREVPGNAPDSMSNKEGRPEERGCRGCDQRKLLEKETLESGFKARQP